MMRSIYNMPIELATLCLCDLFNWIMILTIIIYYTGKTVQSRHFWKSTSRCLRIRRFRRKRRCARKLNRLPKLQGRIYNGLLRTRRLLNFNVDLLGFYRKIRHVQQTGDEVHVRLGLRTHRHFQLCDVSLPGEVHYSWVDVRHRFWIRRFVHTPLSDIIQILPVKDLSQKGRLLLFFVCNNYSFKSPPGTKRSYGLDCAILISQTYLGQLIMSLIAGPIIAAYSSPSVIFLICSICSVCGAFASGFLVHYQVKEPLK